jgi:adenylate cyclase, class 1
MVVICPSPVSNRIFQKTSHVELFFCLNRLFPIGYYYKNYKCNYIMEASQDISQLLSKYNAYNEKKLDQCYSLISTGQDVKIIQLLPALFCFNHPKLPGYIPDTLPPGIALYKPDDQSVRNLKTRFRISSLEYNNEVESILALALIGSVGSVAYNRNSDFDYWIVIDRRDMTDDTYENLVEKTSLIEAWGRKETGREISFFINDITAIQEKRFADSEDEVMGSAAGALLMDEFYRSSILVAGKVPLWWVIKGNPTDREYQEIKNSFSEEELSGFIDLGNLHSISKEDFFGALLFQILKSLGNPYKSIIKMGLIEKYLTSPEGTPLLSTLMKENVHSGNSHNNTDSYIQMFNEVLNFYLQQERPATVEVLKINFYLKIAPALSRYRTVHKSKKLPYHVEVMDEYITRWQWRDEIIDSLDSFENWDYTKLLEFWQQIQKTMVQIYQNITSSVPNLDMSRVMSQNDLKFLSTKFKRHFMVSENKVENLISFKDSPTEPILYLESINEGITTTRWRLYKTVKDNHGGSEQVTIKTDNTIVPLLVWAASNKVYETGISRIKVKSGYRKIDENFIIRILDNLSTVTSHHIAISNTFLLQEPFIIQNAVIVMEKNQNEEQLLYHIYRTSWDETFIDQHEINDMMSLLSTIIKDADKIESYDKSLFTVILFDEKDREGREIKQIFEESYKMRFLVTRKFIRVIAAKNDQYVTMCRSKDFHDLGYYKNTLQLLSTLSLKPRANIEYRFMGSSIQLEILQQLWKTKKDKAMTIFYLESRNNVTIYTFNETGNLFTYVYREDLAKESVLATYLFCRNTLSILKKLKLQSLPSIEIYRVLVDGARNITLKDETKKIRDLIIINEHTMTSIALRIDKTETWQGHLLVSDKTRDKKEISIGPYPHEEMGRMVKKSMGNKRQDFFQITSCSIKGLKKSDLAAGSAIYFLEKYRMEFLIKQAFSS